MPVGNKIREKLRKLQLRTGFPNEMVMKVRSEKQTYFRIESGSRRGKISP
jgi:hypothetical protein